MFSILLAPHQVSPPERQSHDRIANQMRSENTSGTVTIAYSVCSCNVFSILLAPHQVSPPERQSYDRIANQMRGELSENTSGTVTIV